MAERKRALSPPPPSRGGSICSIGSSDLSGEEIPFSRQASVDQTCLTEDGVKHALAEKVKHVMETLQIEENTARDQLMRTRPTWDVNAAIVAWFDTGRCQQPTEQQSLVGENASVVCQMCGDDQKNELCFQLSCGHMTCTECLDNFLQSRLHPSDGSAPLRPPYTCRQMQTTHAVDCDGVLEVESARLPLNDADLAQLARLGEPALECETPYRKCPAEGCRHYNRRPESGHVNLRCQCGAHYCFACVIFRVYRTREDLGCSC